MSENLKPCIACQQPCSMFMLQLGDFFTLTYLRICGHKCLFTLAYNFLYGLYEHKNFRNHLQDLENEEDKKKREEYMAFADRKFYDKLKENFNDLDLIPNEPIIRIVYEDFNNKPDFPSIYDKDILVFKRYNFTKKQRIDIQKKFIIKHENIVKEALEELAKIEGEHEDE